MELWNIRDLQPPPLNTYKPTTRKLDLKKIRNTLQEGLRFFKDTGYMYAESAVLSRIVYRMKLKFRSAKDFKSLEKLNHALKIFIKANPANYIDNFIDLLPGKYDDETYLPTKNMLDYILVRIQGLAKLLERMFETTKIAAYQLETRIRTGHFWKVALIAIALVARIYVLVKHTAKFLCDYYVDLLKYSFKLENTSVSWLPEGQELPKNLREWLNVTWIDEDEIIEIPSDIPQIMQFFDLVDDEDDDVQFCDEYIMVNDNEEDVEIVNEFRNLRPLPGKKQNVSHNNMRGFSVDDDIGEIIKIEDTVTKQVPQKMKTKKKKTNVVKQLNLNNNEEETTAIVGSEDCEKENINNDIGEIISIEDSIMENSILPTNNNLPGDYMSKFPEDIGEVITIEDSVKKKTPKKRKLKQNENKAAKRLKLTGNSNSLNKSVEMISDSECSGIVVLDDTLNNSRTTQSSVCGNNSAILLSDEENQTPKSTQKSPKAALVSDAIKYSTTNSMNKKKRSKKKKKTQPLNSGNTSVSNNGKIIKNKKRKKKKKGINNKPKQ